MVGRYKQKVGSWLGNIPVAQSWTGTLYRSLGFYTGGTSLEQLLNLKSCEDRRGRESVYSGYIHFGGIRRYTSHCKRTN